MPIMRSSCNHVVNKLRLQYIIAGTRVAAAGRQDVVGEMDTWIYDVMLYETLASMARQEQDNIEVGAIEMTRS